MKWNVEVTIEWAEEIEAPTQQIAEDMARLRAKNACREGDVFVEAFADDD